MNGKNRVLSIIILLSLALGLVGPTAALAVMQPVEVQPIIYQIAAESPDLLIRVVIQKSDNSGRAFKIVESLGGKVLKELEFINAFVAEIPAGNVSNLAAHAPVAWITLDAPVESSAVKVTLQSYTVRDEFNLPGFDNNDGQADWKTPWLINAATETETNSLYYLPSEDPNAKIVSPLDVTDSLHCAIRRYPAHPEN